MAIYKNTPPIVTSGLVLNLDAGNTLSYQSGSINWYDLSGNNNNVTLYNGTSFSTAHRGVVEFDGTNDYGKNTSTPIGFNFNSTNAMSAEAWINYSPDNYDFWFTANNNGIKYRFGTTIFRQIYWDMGQHTDRYTAYLLPSGSWNQVVFTGGLEDGFITTRIYVNSFFITSVNEGISSLSTITEFLIGHGEAVGVHPFNGRISNIKIYNKVLSPSEVLQNYNAMKRRFNLD